jgi:hypothetical protein
MASLAGGALVLHWGGVARSCVLGMARMAGCCFYGVLNGKNIIRVRRYCLGSYGICSVS